jgi:hypothetical protein
MPRGIPGKIAHCVGRLSQTTYQHRRNLVKRGKASWLNRYLSMEEALKVAGF